MTVQYEKYKSWSFPVGFDVVLPQQLLYLEVLLT